MKNLDPLHLTPPGRWLWLLAVVSILFTGCSKEKDEPQPVAVNRTVLVYMLSDNNLGANYYFDSQNIDEMMQAATQTNQTGPLGTGSKGHRQGVPRPQFVHRRGAALGRRRDRAVVPR